MNAHTLALTLLFVIGLAAPLALAACGGDTADKPMEGQLSSDIMDRNGMDASATSRGAMEPRMENGVQVLDINVGPGGYEPRDIRLRTGVPARLVFTRTTDETCATQIKVPAFDIGPVDLPLGEPVAVELTPNGVGDFTFTCGMDMVSGSLMIQP